MRAPRFLPSIVALALIGASVGGCGSSTGAPPPKTNGHRLIVTIRGNPLGNPDSLYSPARLRIQAGESVVWIDRDDSDHTVSPDFNYGGWRGGSAILRHGERYSHRFTRPGIYRYHCMVHQNMLGVVIVHR